MTLNASRFDEEFCYFFFFFFFGTKSSSFIRQIVRKLIQEQDDLGTYMFPKYNITDTRRGFLQPHMV